MDCGHCGVPVTSVLLELTIKGAGGKSAGLDNDRAARVEGRKKGAEQAMHVEERHDKKIAVGGRELVRGCDIVHCRRQILVGERHGFRASGGTRRV